MDDESRYQRVSQAAQTALNLSHGVKNLLQAVKGGVEVVDYGFEIDDIERAKKGWEILKTQPVQDKQTCSGYADVQQGK